MTEEQKAADIKRGLEITAEIEKLEAELKAIVSRLEAAALQGPHVPLEDKEREGKQAILTSPTHRLAVRFESDVLVGGFEMGSDLDNIVCDLLTTVQFNELFKPVRKYERKEKDGHKFRLKAKKAIPDHAVYLNLIKALRSTDADGIAKSKTVIAWDAVQVITPDAAEKSA
jgi:hypothetical protein